jgi:cytochrome c-type biogenesis protein CcmH/NrfG
MSADSKNSSLDEVTQMMADCEPNSMNDQKARAEFLRRQTKAIQESAAATKRYTLYMLISVVLLLISVIGTLLLNYLNYVDSR